MAKLKFCFELIKEKKKKKRKKKKEKRKKKKEWGVPHQPVVCLDKCSVTVGVLLQLGPLIHF